MSWGSLALAIALMAATHPIERSIDHYLGGFGVARLLPMVFGALGISMVSSCWSHPGGRPIPTLAVPTAAYLAFAAAVTAWSWEANVNIESGHVGYELLAAFFKMISVLAAVRMFFTSSSMARRAKGTREKFYLCLMRASAALGIIGCMVSLGIQFAGLTPAPLGLMAIRDAANATAFFGAASGVTVLLAVSIRIRVLRHVQHRRLKALMPELEAVWAKAMPSAPDLIHPLAGGSLEARAHRMAIEIHDATSYSQELLEELDEEDFIVLEEVEEVLSA